MSKLTAQEMTQLRRIQSTINAAIDRALDSMWQNSPPAPADLVIIEHSGTVLAPMLKEIGDRP